MINIYYIKLKNKLIYQIKKVNKIKKIFKETNDANIYLKDYILFNNLLKNNNLKLYLNNKKKIKQFYILVEDNNNNNVDYALLYFDKLKEIKILDESLKKEKKANISKTIFLQAISHDIRTPMNAIIGFTDLALKLINDQEKVEDYLKKISISSLHLLNLLNNVLDMSKIESGKLEVDYKKCSLRDLIFEIKNVFVNLIKEKELNFEIKTCNIINEDIYTDILRLKQVFINLINNSIKYTLNGGKIEFIIKQVSFNNKNCDYLFIVRDNGIGMNNEFIKSAFEPFSRETQVKEIQGTGLGLAIVNGIISKMNGKIEVSSSLGSGTEFIVNLNFKVDENNMISKLKDFDGLKILYLSDEFLIKDFIDDLYKANIALEKFNDPKQLTIRLNQCINFNSYFDLCIIEEDFYFNNINLIIEIRNKFPNFQMILIKNKYDNKNLQYIDLIIDRPLLLSDFIELFINNNLKRKVKTIENNNIIKKKILIVDDNELNRDMTMEILKINGYELEEASNGEEALNLIINNSVSYYNLILMDIQMPVMDGIQCTKCIRNIGNERRNIPIIAMTANAFEEEKNEIIKSGINKYISKPINLDNLLSLVKEYLN